MWKKAAAAVCLVLVMVCGCGGTPKAAESGAAKTEETKTQEMAGDALTQDKREQASAENTAGFANTQAAAQAETGNTGSTRAETASADATAAAGHTGKTAAEYAAESRGLIVIDPGHQQYGNSDQEPVGPGASDTKAKVSGGTSGIASGVPEYQLTLDIGLQLRDELEARGYTVIMTRETNEVDISNSERAAVANEAAADAFIRIHANGSDNHGVTGAMTICQTPGNIYNGDLYEESRKLADCVLNAYTEKTGIDYEYVWETDSMSGINWAQVPVTIIEMGYMTNADEDLLMQNPQFQEKMTDGIAEGIDAYMAEKTSREE
jgi:N-acetylmuramoyl-L-alanine amidase